MCGAVNLQERSQRGEERKRLVILHNTKKGKLEAAAAKFTRSKLATYRSTMQTTPSLATGTPEHSESQGTGVIINSNKPKPKSVHQLTWFPARSANKLLQGPLPGSNPGAKRKVEKHKCWQGGPTCTTAFSFQQEKATCPMWAPTAILDALSSLTFKKPTAASVPYEINPITWLDHRYQEMFRDGAARKLGLHQLWPPLLHGQRDCPGAQLGKRPRGPSRPPEPLECPGLAERGGIERGLHRARAASSAGSRRGCRALTLPHLYRS